MGIRQAILDGIPGSHENHSLLGSQEQHRRQDQANHGCDDHALRGRPVRISMVLLPDVPGYRRTDPYPQAVSYAYQDRVDGVDYAESAHCRPPEPGHPQAVNDAVELLEEQSHTDRYS